MGAAQRPRGIPVKSIHTIPPVVNVRGDLFFKGCTTAAEWAESVHVTDAQPRAGFERASRRPARAYTKRSCRGGAWFLATRLDQDGMSAVLQQLIDESRISGSGFPSKREQQRTDSWSRSGGDLRFVITTTTVPCR
ncbi:beta-galactosidase trimerization domain-containing protein [Leifsonia sp. SIMBA_070]|uniref:beta-galactosidase trimerization domain-containing protein n=1 Tax=Leifsonia sp. SIMBA_070 TaxID=3085810 RepID=UPI003979F1E5